MKKFNPAAGRPKKEGRNERDFYRTPTHIAEYCVKSVLSKYDDGKKMWIDPFAGDGVFYQFLPKERRLAFDLQPQADDIIQRDTLTKEFVKEFKDCEFISNIPFSCGNKVFKLYNKGHFIIPGSSVFRKNVYYEDMIFFVDNRTNNRSYLIFNDRLIFCVFASFTRGEQDNKAYKIARELEGQTGCIRISPFISTMIKDRWNVIDSTTLEKVDKNTCFVKKLKESIFIKDCGEKV